MKRPHPEEFDPYYKNYIDLVGENDFLKALADHHEDTRKLLKKIPEFQADMSYEKGKWTIKQVVNHLIDTERIFAYRALSFARGEEQSLPGYDHNDYVAKANLKKRKLEDLVNEFKNVRVATFDLFNSFGENELLCSGKANDNALSVRAIGFIIPGHEMHHMKVIKEKYLPVLN